MKYLLSLLFAGVGLLPAATVSFDLIPTGHYSSGASFTVEGGVLLTITTVGGSGGFSIMDLAGRRTLLADDFAGGMYSMRLSFSQVVSPVTVFGGDGGGDDDGDMLVDAYDASNNLLGTGNSHVGTASIFAGWNSVLVDSAGVRELVLRTNGTEYPHSILWALGEGEPGGGAVPEPSTTVAMVTGLGVLAWWRRRQ